MLLQMFNDSVTPLVKIISLSLGALMNVCTVLRACSYCVVEIWLSVWMPRWILLLVREYASAIASITACGFCVVAALSKYTSGWLLTVLPNIGKSFRMDCTSYITYVFAKLAK